MHSIRFSAGAFLPNLLLIIALSTSACEEVDAPAISQPRPVKYAVIQANDIGDERAFPASVQPQNAAQMSFRVSGNLEQLDVQLGATVKKDQVIARLDRADYRVGVAQAQASYHNAQTGLDTAQSRFRRMEKLFEGGGASQSDYENARGQLRSAKAQLDAAAQQVRQAKNQLAYTTLRAPFAGVVNSVAVKVGEQVAAGQTIAVVSRGGALEILARVPESIVSRISVGNAAAVRVSALSAGSSRAGEALPARVREVGFASEQSTYPVKLELNAIPADLRPGMAAQVRIVLTGSDGASATPTLVVPVAAVGHDSDGTFVFVLQLENDRESGTEKSASAGGIHGNDDVYVARKRTVSLGELAGDRFAVTDGLADGDKVATAGLAHLIDGMRVRLLRSHASSGAQSDQAAEAMP